MRRGSGKDRCILPCNVCLNDFVEAEWGVTENNRRAQYYRITPAGRKHLATEKKSLSSRWRGSRGSWRREGKNTMRLAKKIGVLWRQKQFEAELEEEIRIHREMSGEATFGSVALAMECSREVWGLPRLESWKQDIRCAHEGIPPGYSRSAGMSR
jgi:hypothetical protein